MSVMRCARQYVYGYDAIWKGLKRGAFLFFYFLVWFILLLGGSLLTVGALMVTWNVGPSRLLGWNSLAYHEVMGVLAFLCTVYYCVRAVEWIRERFRP